VENEIKRTTVKKCPHCQSPEVTRSGSVLSSGILPSGTFYKDAHYSDAYECSRCKREFIYILKKE
jgi:DNA-directed RNA polymerase subunit RPC12/RpoP